jgi:hypothetical protein
MSLRFFRRVRIVPGLRVNLSKSGASVSIGRRGAWYTIGPRGQRVSVGLPGTGLFWVERARPVRASRVGSVVIALAMLSVMGALVAFFIFTG